MRDSKQINIKNRAYYFFNDIINIKDFDSSLIKVNKRPTKLFTSIILVTSQKKIDDYENINSVISLYLIIGKGDGYIEENNGNKSLIFTYRDGNKEAKLAKLIKLWDETEHLIEPINKGKKGEHKKDFIKVKFNSDDDLLLNKMLLTVIVNSDC